MEILIQYGLNKLKYEGQLPIVADYTSFAFDKKFYVPRERCEFISRLLNTNAVATRNCTKTDYDVTKLGTRQQTQKHTLPTAAATITKLSTASSLSCNHHNTDDEDSTHTDPQHDTSTAITKPSNTSSIATKTVSRGDKKRKNKNRSAATTRSTPIPNRLRVRTKDNSAVASKTIQTKTVVSVVTKRGRILQHEENDENNGNTSLISK